MSVDEDEFLTSEKSFLFSFVAFWCVHTGRVCRVRCERTRTPCFSLTLAFVSQHTEGFKKRWFTMDDRRLMYFKDPLVRGSALTTPPPAV